MELGCYETVRGKAEGDGGKLVWLFVVVDVVG